MANCHRLVDLGKNYNRTQHSKRRKAGNLPLPILANGKLAEFPGQLLLNYVSKTSTIQQVCMMGLVCKEWRFIKCARRPLHSPSLTPLAA